MLSVQLVGGAYVSQKPNQSDRGESSGWEVDGGAGVGGV